ncbi:MAG: hypothetical protein DMF11_07760, partial [Verrucomicrobia bacterium]
MKLKKTVAELVRDALYFCNLLDGQIFFTGPGINLCQVHGEIDAANGVLGGGQQFACAPSFLQCLFLASKTRINHAQKADSGRKVGLLRQKVFYFAPSSGKGRLRLRRVTLP